MKTTSTWKTSNWNFSLKFKLHLYPTGFQYMKLENCNTSTKVSVAQKWYCVLVPDKGLRQSALIIFKKKQECIPVGCVPPAAVAVGGVSTRHHPRSRHPPQDQTPQSRYPPGTRPPWSRYPPRTKPPKQVPPPLWTESQTPVKNITFPQLRL